MRPDDRKWAIGITVGIAVFFVMVILAGRVYLTNIDDSFTLSSSTDMINAKLMIRMVRNDSKSIPIQVNPPVLARSALGGSKVYIQREYMAHNSLATLQVRSAAPILLDSDSPPNGTQLQVELLHFRAPTHRPVIVVKPDPNLTRSTDIYLDEINATMIWHQTIDLPMRWERGLFGKRCTAKLRENFFTFSGQDDLWKIDAYDSITQSWASFNGMALLKVRARLVVTWDDGSRASTDWMETQFFAIDLT